MFELQFCWPWQWQKKKKPEYAPAQKISNTELTIPDGWFVFEMGQSISHMLWNCQMINFNDLIDKVARPRRVWVEEMDTPWEAMQGCIEAINKGDYI